MAASQWEGDEPPGGAGHLSTPQALQPLALQALELGREPITLIGAYYNPTTLQFAELLIDAETDPALRAVLVGMLRGP